MTLKYFIFGTSKFVIARNPSPPTLLEAQLAYAYIWNKILVLATEPCSSVTVRHYQIDKKLPFQYIYMHEAFTKLAGQL